MSATEPGADTQTGRLGRVDYLIASLITLAGGVLRFITLGRPNSFVFDEVYYAKDACYYIKGAVETCALSGEGEQTLVHPPLGKWLLSIGVKLFGFDSFGWRVAAAMAGTATIFLLYVLAKKLLRSTLGASIASGLLALDLLHLVQSRISMLDIFLPLFAVGALIFLVIDRDRRNAGTTSVLPRVGAGLMLAGGLATKWSGGFFIPFAIVLVIAWEAGRRRAAGSERNLTHALRTETLSCILYFVLLPVAVYVLTYVGRLGTFLSLPWSKGSLLREVWDTQFYMLDYHANLESLHGYQSPPWSWPLVKRPVSYFFDSSGGTYREIMAFGSPFVWWSSLLALAFAGYRWIRSRAIGSPEGVIVGAFFFAYVPWLIQPTGRAAVFLFYLLPAVPFMCLALGYVGVRIGDSTEARLAIGIFAAATVASFIYFMPLAMNRPISEAEWRSRIWFEDCTKPEGYEGSPRGWCWI